MKAVRITVTRSHIKRGAPKSCGWCPIALALQEKFETNNVRVLNFHADVPMTGFFVMSEPARQFVNDFDAGRQVKPATFILRRDKRGR